MKEQIVTFETAKLAKEKEFQEYYKGFYNLEGEYVPDSLHNNKDNELITAPSQTILQRWLRKKKNIHISVVLNHSIEYPYKPADEEYTYEEDEKWVDIKDYDMVTIATPKKAYELITDTKTYEEALEKGLQTGLDLI